jgi:signal transduction histidine kinase
VSADESRVLAQEQAALRRVATLAARGATPEEVFAAVAEEVGQLLAVDFAYMGRYEPEGAVTIIAAWARAGPATPVGSQFMLGGTNLGTMVFETGRTTRFDNLAEASGPVGVAARESGFRSSVGTPILVEGCLWGVMAVGSSLDQGLPAGTESRLVQFTELVATAIANAESRAGLARLAEEQAALRRVATLVAHGASPEDVFAAVTEEVGRLLSVDVAALGRYGSGGTLTFLAVWGSAAERFPVGSRWSLGGNDVGTIVFETGRPARVDSFADPSGPLGLATRDEGVGSAVGTPVVVDGRLWGVMATHSPIGQPLSADTGVRLGSFTELVATAIANAESRAALSASRARVVAAADETRRRIERDLHDGTQQQLVSLMLELRAAEAAGPSDVRELRAQLARTGRGLGAVLDELRKIAHGIHPAILSTGGLERALRGLARRSAVPVELDLRPERRLPEHVEAAAYYVVSEALTNAAKHAQAFKVHVELEAGARTVRLAIRDDGVGGADPGRGSGLVGLSDRVEALGGTLELTSPAGRGTTLRIEIPVEGHSNAEAPGP